MAETDVSICNKALVLLGSDLITSLDSSIDPSDKATICAQVYPSLRDTLLGRRAWRFAMKKFQLSRLVAAPLNEWTYAYQLPSDRIGAPVMMWDTLDTRGTPIKEWEIFEDKVYTHAELVVAEYKFRPDESRWPSYFVDLMVAGLAGYAGMAITDKSTIAQEWMLRAFGPPSENGRGGLFLAAAADDAAGNVEDSAIEADDLVIARLS